MFAVRPSTWIVPVLSLLVACCLPLMVLLGAADPAGSQPGSPVPETLSLVFMGGALMLLGYVLRKSRPAPAPAAQDVSEEEKVRAWLALPPADARVSAPISASVSELPVRARAIRENAKAEAADFLGTASARSA